MNECVICAIVAGTAKSFPVYEDENFIAFLDIRPLFVGHCLLSPKNHIPNLYELPDDQLQNYFSLVKRIGRSIEISMNAKGSFIAINNTVSQMAPYHLHTHIVPRNPQDGLKGFFWPRTQYETEEKMSITQKEIKIILNTISAN